MKPEVTAEFLKSQGLSATTPERFWTKVDVRGSDDCWPWLGSRDRHGYGYMNRGRHSSGPICASAVSWILNKGAVPKGFEVCHDCPGGDHPWCVNPAHLWLGTHAQNMADMKAKGRSSGGVTFGHVLAKVTQEQVQEIRRLYQSPDRNVQTIAHRFGICRRQVWMIGSGRCWPNA